MSRPARSSDGASPRRGAGARAALAAAALWASSGCAAIQPVVYDAYALWTATMNGAVAAASPPRPDVAVPHGIEAVEALAALCWVVPVEGGVVVVDAGLDPDAALLRRGLGDRRVLGVLLTHGHPDHAAGAAALGAPVYVGAPDVPRLAGAHHEGAIVPHAAQHLFGGAPAPARLVPVDDGDEVVLGGARFVAVSVPGHTEGSTMWLFRDVLFSGDALTNMTGQRLEVAPFPVTDDVRRAHRSLRRLRDLDFAVIADAHYGATLDGPRLVRDLVAQHREHERFVVPFLDR